MGEIFEVQDGSIRPLLMNTEATTVAGTVACWAAPLRTLWPKSAAVVHLAVAGQPHGLDGAVAADDAPRLLSRGQVEGATGVAQLVGKAAR